MDKEQIKKVYNERMLLDFPKDELKPVDTILEATDRGIYECFGILDEDKLVGYTFLEKFGNDYIVDYLAMLPAIRNKGVGSMAIGLISDYVNGAGSVFLEVEDPEFAKNDEDRSLQTRRIGFYKRNGFCDTGLRVTCFEVPFIILEMGEKRSRSMDEIWELYKEMYRQILPAGLYEGALERKSFGQE